MSSISLVVVQSIEVLLLCTSVVIDAALVAGGMDDHFDRAAKDYANGFDDRLSALRA